MADSWQELHTGLLERAKRLKAQPVVSRDEVAALQEEIRDLERRIDRPVKGTAVATRAVPSLQTEQVGRVPMDRSPPRPERRCALGSCDGSGWHLRPEVDVADPCRCQGLPRDPGARRQNRRVLRRHLALSLDAPPLANLDPFSRTALRNYCEDIEKTIARGGGLWLAGESTTDAACAFLAGEALRRSRSVLIYPADELIGRLRRLAATDPAALEEELYRRLAQTELLVLTELDGPAAPHRYPEQMPEETKRGVAGGGEETPVRGPALAKPPADETEVPAYRPAMTDADLARVMQIVDQRWMAQRSTVIATSSNAGVLEERFLRVAGEWPPAEYWGGHGDSAWGEPKRRALGLRRLLSRLSALCGPPLPVG